MCTVGTWLWSVRSRRSCFGSSLANNCCICALLSNDGTRYPINIHCYRLTTQTETVYLQKLASIKKSCRSANWVNFWVYANCPAVFTRPVTVLCWITDESSAKHWKVNIWILALWRFIVTNNCINRANHVICKTRFYINQSFPISQLLTNFKVIKRLPVAW